MSNQSPSDFYDRILNILQTARTNIARTVNTTQVLSNWLIGREIIEEEQQGKQRADYGKQLLQNLAQKLKQDFGKGYSYPTLKLIRQFYLAYPALLSPEEIGYALRSQSQPNPQLLSPSQPNPAWKPGQLHPNLSWTHYRTLMRVDPTTKNAAPQTTTPPSASSSAPTKTTPSSNTPSAPANKTKSSLAATNSTSPPKLNFKPSCSERLHSSNPNHLIRCLSN